jgi:hypothetical protein
MDKPTGAHKSRFAKRLAVVGAAAILAGGGIAFAQANESSLAHADTSSVSVSNGTTSSQPSIGGGGGRPSISGGGGSADGNGEGDN